RVEVAELEYLSPFEREREGHFHLRGPRGFLAAFFVHRDAFGQPPRDALVRKLQSDQMLQHVPERRLPRERAWRLGSRRVHADDTAEAGAERANQAGQAEVPDREVVVDGKDFDEDGTLRRELILRRQLLEGFVCEWNRVLAQDLGLVR